MAEAEDVITDAALHATKFVHGLWRRHRAHAVATPNLALADVAQRLDLLIVAVFGRACPLRVAQVPARATFLARTFQRQKIPRVQGSIPTTDGAQIWLPAEAGLTDAAMALERFHTVALQQAMRVVRGSAAGAGSGATPLVRDLYLLIEAHAADADLAQLLPGMLAPLQALRAAALSARPALSQFAAGRHVLEVWVRRLMGAPVSVRGSDREERDARHFHRGGVQADARVLPVAFRRDQHRWRNQQHLRDRQRWLFQRRCLHGHGVGESNEHIRDRLP